VAYATLAEGRDQDALEELDIAVGMIRDPADDAIAALRAYQEEAGMTFEDPDAPVAPTPGAQDEEFLGEVMRSGEIRGEAW